MTLDRPHHVSIAIFVATLIMTSMISSRGLPKVISTNLEHIPMRIGHYDGVEDYFDPAIYKELNADKHVYRHYGSAGGSQVNMYIGYYGTAKGGRTGHNPYACLPGAGWGIIKTGKKELKLNETIVSVNEVIARKGETYQVLIHWYQSAGDKVLSNGIKQNIHRFWKRIIHNRNDGAYVQISTIAGSDGLAIAKDRVRDFSEKIINIIPEYWPVEG